MRIYLDPNYTPPVIRLIQSLHSLEFPETFEVVTGQWSKEYHNSDTAVFLLDTNKKGLNTITIDHYQEGYKVVAFKKPTGSAFDPFICALTLLSQWKRILSDLENVEGRLLISIGSGKHPYRDVFKDGGKKELSLD
ncbi:MAG TPA: hypothetical protein VL125_00070 [Pelobium sp.]|nr:hypothetical protein [Pelobium sp.]